MQERVRPPSITEHWPAIQQPALPLGVGNPFREAAPGGRRHAQHHPVLSHAGGGVGGRGGDGGGPPMAPLSLPSLPSDFPTLSGPGLGGGGSGGGPHPPQNPGQNPAPGGASGQSSASVIAARGLRAAADRNASLSSVSSGAAAGDGGHGVADFIAARRHSPPGGASAARHARRGAAAGGQPSQQQGQLAAEAPAHIQADEVNMMLSFLGGVDAAAVDVHRPPSAGPVAGVPLQGGLLGRRHPGAELEPPRTQPPPALPSPPLQQVPMHYIFCACTSPPLAGACNACPTAIPHCDLGVAPVSVWPQDVSVCSDPGIQRQNSAATSFLCQSTDSLARSHAAHLRLHRAQQPAELRLCARDDNGAAVLKAQQCDAGGPAPRLCGRHCGRAALGARRHTHAGRSPILTELIFLNAAVNVHLA